MKTLLHSIQSYVYWDISFDFVTYFSNLASFGLDMHMLNRKSKDPSCFFLFSNKEYDLHCNTNA
jgi:hypothetical protein